MPSLRVIVGVGAFALFGSGIVSACTHDFDAPFSQSKNEVGQSNVDGGGSSGGDGSAGTACESPIRAGYAEIVTPSAAAYYRLDEESGDVRGVGKSPPNGARHPSVKRIARGALLESNGALRFSQKENGTIGFGDVWGTFAGGTTQPLAIEFWFRIEALATTRHVLFSKAHANGGTDSIVGFRLSVTPQGILQFERRTSGGLGFVMDGGTVVVGRWHHVAVKRYIPGLATSPVLRMALDDGPEIGEGDTRDFAPTNDPFVIGPLDGDVDELAVYDTLSDLLMLLEPIDIKQRLNAVASSDCTKNLTTRIHCFGPEAIGGCGISNKTAIWTQSCAPNEVCMFNPGNEARCQRCVP
jgi:hypothetical protein